MTEEEINKIITEFMGLEYYPEHDFIYSKSHAISAAYTQSLDALIPVVERLDIYDLKFTALGKSWNDFECRVELDSANYYKDEGHTPSMALATACAKVIKERTPDSKEQ